MTSRFPAQPELAGHPYFQFRNNVLYAEDVPLDHLAEKLGTPLYVYSRAALRAAWESYRNAVGEHPVLVCYGMKANSNLAVLKEFARLGAQAFHPAQARDRRQVHALRNFLAGALIVFLHALQDLEVEIV